MLGCNDIEISKMACKCSNAPILSSVFDQFDEEVFHRCRFYVDSLPNLQIVMLYRIRLLWIAYILDCSMQKFDLALDNLYTVRNSRYHL